MKISDFKIDKEVIQGETDPCERSLQSLYEKS